MHGVHSELSSNSAKTPGKPTLQAAWINFLVFIPPIILVAVLELLVHNAGVSLPSCTKRAMQKWPAARLFWEAGALACLGSARERVLQKAGMMHSQKEELKVLETGGMPT